MGFFDAALLKYRKIISGSSELPPRGRIRFVGGTATDNAANDSTDLIISGSGQTFQIASTSSTLNPGDVVAPLPSDPTQITLGTPTAVQAAQAISGIYPGPGAAGPGASITIATPGDTVAASVFGDLGGGARALLKLLSTGRSARQPIWSGSDIRVGGIDPTGNVTVDPFVPVKVAPGQSYRPRAFGCPWDGVHDDRPGLDAMIAQMKLDAAARGDNTNALGRIELEPGEGYVSDTWNIDGCVEVFGPAGGGTQNKLCGLRSAPGKSVIRTWAVGSPNPTPGTAEGSSFAHFHVTSSAMCPTDTGFGISATRTAGFLAAGKCVVPTPNTNKIFFRWSGEGTGIVPGSGDLAAFATATPQTAPIADGPGHWQCEDMPKPRLDSHQYNIGDRYLNFGANGVLVDQTPFTVTGATNATPIEVTVSQPHNRKTGDLAMISGVTGNTNANGLFTVVVTAYNTFTLRDRNTAGNIAGNGTFGGTPTAIFGDQSNVFYYECTVAGISGDATHRPARLNWNDIAVQNLGNTFADGAATFTQLTSSLIVSGSAFNSFEYIAGWDCTNYVIHGEGYSFSGGCDFISLFKIYGVGGIGGCVSLVGQDANGWQADMVFSLNVGFFIYNNLSAAETRNYGGHTIFDASLAGGDCGMVYGQDSYARAVLSINTSASMFRAHFSENPMPSRVGPSGKIISCAGVIEGTGSSWTSGGHTKNLLGLDETRTNELRTYLGVNDGVTTLAVLANPAESSQFSGFSWSNELGGWPTGWWAWANVGTPSTVSFAVPGPVANWPDGTSFGMYGLWSPTRLFLGPSSANPPSIDFGVAKPSSGKFAFGSVRFDQNRFGGSNAGWVNVAAGSPGTWVEFGSYMENVEPPGGRLSLTSGTAVTTADVTGATTIYFTPHQYGRITLYNVGTGLWEVFLIGELSLALGTLTSGKNYDVFAYSNAGVVTLELSVWNTDTVRLSSLAQQDGVWVKSADHARLHLGTFRTTATTTTEDSAAKRFVRNRYNALPRKLKVIETTASWAYTSAAYQAANAAAGNAFEYIGEADSLLRADVHGLVSTTSATSVAVATGVGIDSTTVQSADLFGMKAPADPANVEGPVDCDATYRGYPGIGYHKITWLEYGGTSVTFYGQGTPYQCGMLGEVLG